MFGMDIINGLSSKREKIVVAWQNRKAWGKATKKRSVDQGGQAAESDRAIWKRKEMSVAGAEGSLYRKEMELCLGRIRSKRALTARLSNMNLVLQAIGNLEWPISRTLKCLRNILLRKLPWCSFAERIRGGRSGLGKKEMGARS